MNLLARFARYATLVAATGMTAGLSARPIDIRHTAPDNTLVRTTADAHYLLLPVEDDAPDMRIDVLDGGAIVHTCYVRLARHAVDYTVPFDLTPYVGRELLFNVIAEEPLRLHQMEKFVCWKAPRTADAFDTANREKYRPVYHHTLLYGWMNAPNGMFWKEGVWHLCFQYNPYGSKWQNMTWGHSVSCDLVHWTQGPSVLAPDGLDSVFGGSATQYFIGDFDGHRFVCDAHPDETLWMDYGKDHYAAVTWSDAPDNRRTAIAWMSNWEYADAVPTLQFRSANTLPRDLELFRLADGSLRLAVKPAREVEQLRRGKTTLPAAALTASPVVCPLPAEADGVCEIELALDFGRARKINLMLSNEAGERVCMTCDLPDPQKRTFVMHRQQSGATDFSLAFPATTVAPMPGAGNKCTLRLFLDRCSVEVFGANGEFAMTNLLFPASPYTSLTLSAEGGAARMEHLTVYPLGTAE